MFLTLIYILSVLAIQKKNKKETDKPAISFLIP